MQFVGEPGIWSLSCLFSVRHSSQATIIQTLSGGPQALVELCRQIANRLLLCNAVPDEGGINLGEVVTLLEGSIGSHRLQALEGAVGSLLSTIAADGELPTASTSLPYLEQIPLLLSVDYSGLPAMQGKRKVYKRAELLLLGSCKLLFWSKSDAAINTDPSLKDTQK